MSITNVRRPSFTGAVGANDAGAVGDQGETVMLMKMKATEEFNSAVIAEIPAGATFEVVGIGTTPSRIRIMWANQAGWISKVTEQGQPLVKWIRKKRTSMKDMTPMMRKVSGDSEADGEISIGDVCETVVMMVVREGQDPKSTGIGQIPEKTQFEIVEVGQAGRVKVMVSEAILEGGAIGWLSVKTDTGSSLGKKVARKRRTSLNLSKHLAVPIAASQPTGVSSMELASGLKRTMSPMPVTNNAPIPKKVAPAPVPAPAPEPTNGTKIKDMPAAPAPASKSPWWLCCGV